MLTEHWKSIGQSDLYSGATCLTTFSLVNQTEINLRLVKNHRWTVTLPLSSWPLQPSQLIPHPHFFITPFCKFLNSAQDAQSINKTLSPPPGARAQQATQEPARFPLKPLHWWPPGMPVALGTGSTGLDWEVGVWKPDNRTSPIMLICWGKTVKICRETKGKAFHSQGSEAPPASSHS